MADILLPADYGPHIYKDGDIFGRVGVEQGLPNATVDGDDVLNIQPFVYNTVDENGRSSYTSLQRAVSRQKYYRTIFSPALLNSRWFMFLTPTAGVLRMWTNAAGVTMYVDGVPVSGLPINDVEADAKGINVAEGQTITMSANDLNYRASMTFLPYQYPLPSTFRFAGNYRFQDRDNHANFNMDWTTVQDQGQDFSGPYRVNDDSDGDGIVFFTVPRDLLLHNKLQWRRLHEGDSTRRIDLYDGELDPVESYPHSGQTLYYSTGSLISHSDDNGVQTETFTIPDISSWGEKVTILVTLGAYWAVPAPKLLTHYLRVLDSSNAVLHDFDWLLRTPSAEQFEGQSSYGTFNV